LWAALGNQRHARGLPVAATFGTHTNTPAWGRGSQLRRRRRMCRPTCVARHASGTHLPRALRRLGPRSPREPGWPNERVEVSARRFSRQYPEPRTARLRVLLPTGTDPEHRQPAVLPGLGLSSGANVSKRSLEGRRCAPLVGPRFQHTTRQPRAPSQRTAEEARLSGPPNPTARHLAAWGQPGRLDQNPRRRSPPWGPAARSCAAVQPLRARRGGTNTPTPPPPPTSSTATGRRHGRRGPSPYLPQRIGQPASKRKKGDSPPPALPLVDPKRDRPIANNAPLRVADQNTVRQRLLATRPRIVKDPRRQTPPRPRGSPTFAGQLPGPAVGPSPSRTDSGSSSSLGWRF